jgi:hypothetical protein
MAIAGARLYFSRDEGRWIEEMGTKVSVRDRISESENTKRIVMMPYVRASGRNVEIVEKRRETCCKPRVDSVIINGCLWQRVWEHASESGDYASNTSEGLRVL